MDRLDALLAWTVWIPAFAGMTVNRGNDSGARK